MSLSVRKLPNGILGGWTGEMMDEKKPRLHSGGGLPRD